MTTAAAILPAPIPAAPAPPAPPASDAAAPRRYTPKDLLALPDAIQYELVDGELLERGMSSESSWIGGELHARLREVCRSRHLGWTWPADQSYQCFPHAPDQVRKPDVSFIRFGRLPGERLADGHCPLAPDLAVEVISPNDLAEGLELKIRDYLRSGVRLVWVISPATRAARIHRPGRPILELEEQDDLDGEDVVPGFRCRLGDLFPPRPSPDVPVPRPADAG